MRSRYESYDGLDRICCSARSRSWGHVVPVQGGAGKEAWRPALLPDTAGEPLASLAAEVSACPPLAVRPTPITSDFEPLFAVGGSAECGPSVPAEPVPT